MKCPKCAAPMHGYANPCGNCGRGVGFQMPFWGYVGVLVAAALLVSFLSARKPGANGMGNSRNVHSNRLERMPRPERSKAFSKMMSENGEECASVTRSLFRGDNGTNAFWNIRCSNSGDWMIAIAQNSWTRVTGCPALDKAGTPCWTRF